MTGRFKSGLSFRARITIAAMATAVGVLLIACASFMGVQWSAERASLAEHQKQVVKALADDLGRGPAQGEAAQTLLQGLDLSPRVVAAEMTDDQGRVLARYRRRGGDIKGFRLTTRAAVTAGGKPIGELRIEAMSQTAGSLLPRYFAITAALFFMATALSLFLGRLMAKRVIEPVERLSLVMEEVARTNDLGRRVKKLDDDEFGRLIDSFNALLGRLEANENDLRRTLQALVIARDEANAANVQKSQFLANMSHEIRTPLNGVLAMAQILDRGELSEDQRDQVDVIKGSGEALLTILDDILDVSRLEEGRLELELAPFDMERLTKAVVGGVSDMAKAKGLELNLEVTTAGAWLGDGGRVRQILSNLVSNAIKFTERGRVDVRVEGSQAGLRIMVADTGVGLPHEKLEHLFDKFTQLDGGATRRFGGAGLGLAICQALTEKMGGSISVQSVLGQGSIFTVELPLQPSTISEDADVVAETGSDHPLRVLAAEDNPTNQKVLATILEMFGVELEMVENGHLAVEAWRAADYDVILMDIQMPEMDGVAAARAIRAAEAESGRVRTPILAVTANAMSHQAAEYVAAGMDGLVPKPIEINRLQAALEEALATAEAARAAA